MPSETQSAALHKLALAQELVDDIELSRLPAESLLLKAARLARLAGDDEVSAWIFYELSGFCADDPTSLKYMRLTGRWTDQTKQLGYWQSLAQIDSEIATSRLEIQQLQVPNVHFAPSSSNPHEVVSGFAGANIMQATAPIAQVLHRLNALNEVIGSLSGVRSRVLNLLHRFATRIYYELAFSGLQETIFERHKALVESRLAASCGAVLEKVPAIYDRLAVGDLEAISQALNTCRRILNAFADAIYPPADSSESIAGAELKVTAMHHQNRINVYVHRNCESVSRRKRIRRTLEDIYERVTAGVHSDVSAEEARLLFLQSYLLMGEILSLKDVTGAQSTSAAAS